MTFDEMNPLQRRLHNAALVTLVIEAEGDNHGFAKLQRDAIDALQSLQPTPDCRTCTHQYDNKWCSSKVLCTNGDQYQPAPNVVLWRTE